MVEINENQQSIPAAHQPKPIFWHFTHVHIIAMWRTFPQVAMWHTYPDVAMWQKFQMIAMCWTYYRWNIPNIVSSKCDEHTPIILMLQT